MLTVGKENKVLTKKKKKTKQKKQKNTKKERQKQVLIGVSFLSESRAAKDTQLWL